MTVTRGVLAIWHDIDPRHETDVLSWYNREHHLERIGVPGFVRARRHVAIQGTPKFFIYYEVIEPAGLGSDAYLARVNNPTPWTRASMQWFRNNARTVCRVIHDTGGPDGAFVATLRLKPAPNLARELEIALTESIFPRLSRHKLFVRAQLWAADHSVTRIDSEERDIRVVPDHVDDWIIVVSGSDLPAIEDMIAGELSHDALLSAGGPSEMDVGTYQLQYVA
ncbi:hypothetical protein [Aminobacter sp. MSH1]|uniref:hypothetical protein n=1 Tax=Aminobacter sp. MSH1 TaxID=374606 RepID=UPI000D3A8203|nr:hypothetical protein [Aminobacter sp. MSH1]